MVLYSLSMRRSQGLLEEEARQKYVIEHSAQNPLLVRSEMKYTIQKLNQR